MIGDPYEEANQQQTDEAKLVTPEPAKKNPKIVFAGLVFIGILVGIIILANIARVIPVGGKTAGSAETRPTTMTKAQSDAFTKQQGGEALWMKGVDGRNKQQRDEDAVLGKGADLASQQSDPYDEVDGVSKKTKAQDDAEHGRATSASGNSQGGAGKSDAQQRAEKLALEAAHRRQNDLDASPVSVDFSDYFDKQKAGNSGSTSPETKAQPVDIAGMTAARSKAALRDEDEAKGDEEKPAVETASNKKQAHDPKQDYDFDASSGKLYRLMEDSILEDTVLVNRVSGASVGPVITMVATDVYSENGTHLLIPKGTRLLGRVSAVASLNQERLFCAFHRMIMPDGYSVSLDKFQGLDVVGQTGLVDLVNRHYVRIFGASIALAAVAATTQIGNTGASYGSYDWGTSMRNGVSQGLGQSAQRIMERFMNTLPTFTIRERTRVSVMLSGDLLLPDVKNHTMDADL